MGEDIVYFSLLSKYPRCKGNDSLHYSFTFQVTGHIFRYKRIILS